MPDQDLHRVEELFQAAADLPRAEREAYLDERCPDDPSLRANVERLLGRLEQNASFTGPLGSGEAFPRAAITESPGAIIGRYKLLQMIGEGGFGIVYMAEQQEPVVRKVALKIIKLGMDTREVVGRFEAERQALAMMDHPNIAKVLDGGATESGRPYFVMELVRGVAITDYCDRNELSTRERLELFESVCLAVQHAHQKGVIHRDLKPTNVLVTLHDGHPVPKVIDFGVAKAMHTRLTEKTVFTRYEQFIGTPAYMSPEQAEMSALDVDTRTDIYSLGVLLYELLTGTTPFSSDSLRAAGLAEIQRIIREETPPRPSMRISTGADALAARHRRLDVQLLSKYLRGDLDWIVMKSMEKERSRRYASAAALAEDVRRHLRHEPVLAGPPGASYRLRKFLARNKTAAFFVALVGLVLVGGIIGTSIGMIEAERHAARAEREAEHVVSALDFLLSTLSLTNPDVALDPDMTVRALLDHTAARVSDAFEGQPWAEVRVRSTIGRAYAALAENELADTHLRRAVELVDQMTDENADRFGSAGYGLADFYHTLWALTQVAFNSESPDAFVISTRAHATAIRHIASTHPGLARSLDELIESVAGIAWGQEPPADETIGMFEEARAKAAGIPAGDPLWPIIAERFLSAGYMVWYTPQEHLGIDFFSEALDIQRRELPAMHPDTAATVGLLVNVLNKAGRSAEAEQLIRASLDDLRRIYREGNLSIAMAEGTLGENLVGQRRYTEAEPLLLRSHEVIIARVRDENNWIAIESMQRMTALYDAWERPDQARPYRERLALAYTKSNYIPTWSMARHAVGPDRSPMVVQLDLIEQICGGISYRVLDGTASGEDLEDTIHEFDRLRREIITDADPRSAVAARVMLGWANALRPDQVGARRLLAELALPVLEAWSSSMPVEHAEAQALIAVTGDHGPGVARQMGHRAYQTYRQAGGAQTWFVAASGVRIGRCLLRLELVDEAEELLLSGYETLTAQLGARHDDTLFTRAALHQLYTDQGRAEQAARYAPPPARER